MLNQSRRRVVAKNHNIRSQIGGTPNGILPLRLSQHKDSLTNLDTLEHYQGAEHPGPCPDSDNLTDTDMALFALWVMVLLGLIAGYDSIANIIIRWIGM